MAAETIPAKLLIILGPTASGKSELAVRLARAYSAEIINADSMQVYRHMDIGAAKPSPQQLCSIPHHLLSIVDPNEPFSAADFRKAADRAIVDILGRGKRVIVCGGTGLYIRSLTKGLAASPGGDEQIRAELKECALREGNEALHCRLAAADPVSAARIHVNDQFRIIRALEVFHMTGRPISELRREHGFACQHYESLKIGLSLDRASLYRNIDNRVDLMIRNGFVEEVRSLLDSGYTPEMKPMRSLGYRHLCEFFEGTWSLDEAIELIKRDTRRYAKRQMTWFRRDEEINWIEYPENVAIIDDIVNDYFD